MQKQTLIVLAIFLVGGVVLFALLAVFISPGAQGAPLSGDLDAQTIQVAKGLYCPVCPGTPLDVCETQACQQWRDLIREKLSQGQTAAQIEAYFVQQYGERVLGAPRAQGINVLVYALPAFAISGGIALLYLFAARRVKVTPTAAPAATATPNEYIARIERELKQDE